MVLISFLRSENVLRHLLRLYLLPSVSLALHGPTLQLIYAASTHIPYLRPMCTLGSLHTVGEPAKVYPIPISSNQAILVTTQERRSRKLIWIRWL